MPASHAQVNREPAFSEERTWVRSSAPVAGGRALPIGTRIEEFEVTSVIGEGGFGVVYLALDRMLERRVAVKEYLPWTLAARLEGSTTVTVRTQQDAEMFDLGLRSFVNEAKLLAQFDHSALLKVHRFWEGNGTAYMAMPFYDGPTMKQALANRASPPDEAWLREVLEPLLDALTVLHAAQCYHRDISPDNILLTATGPVLLDFGAARRVLSDASQMLTVILKDGYAPVEQYGTSASMRQGPWTDIYALSAVMRYAITGNKAACAVDRLLRDPMQPLAQIKSGQYSAPFLRAIDLGMAVRPEERPQGIAEFRALMDRTDCFAEPLDALGATRLRLPRPVSPSDQRPAFLPMAPPWNRQADAGTGSPQDRRKWVLPIAGIAILLIGSTVLLRGWSHRSASSAPPVDSGSLASYPATSPRPGTPRTAGSVPAESLSSQQRVEQFVTQRERQTRRTEDSRYDSKATSALSASAPEPAKEAPMAHERSPAADELAQKVASIQNVFWKSCGSDPTADPVSVCEPLSSLVAKTRSLLGRVRAGDLSPQDAEQQLKMDREQSSAAGDFEQEVARIHRVFLGSCGLDPTAQPVSVCGPLSTLFKKAHSLLNQVHADELSPQAAEQQLKRAQDQAGRSP